MFFDNVFADPKAEAGAARLLCGEEGLEDSFLRVVRNTGAGIRDGESQTALTCRPVGRGATADQKASAVWHCVEGIADEVCEHLANLAFEADERLIGSLPSFNLDAGVEKATLIKGEDGLDE